MKKNCPTGGQFEIMASLLVAILTPSPPEEKWEGKLLLASGWLGPKHSLKLTYTACTGLFDADTKRQSQVSLLCMHLSVRDRDYYK